MRIANKDGLLRIINVCTGICEVCACVSVQGVTKKKQYSFQYFFSWEKPLSSRMALPDIVLMLEKMTSGLFFFFYASASDCIFFSDSETHLF